MTKPSLVIASDHAGFDLKTGLRRGLEDRGHEVVDLGVDDTTSVDYPDIAKKLVDAMALAIAPRGVLICGTGIGVSIAANRHKTIRAAVCHDVTTARLARAHNDANVICLGGRLIGLEVALDCLETFMATGFEGERHQRRVDKLGRD
jgi:ribose 5-phosphate isomerase B